MIHSLTLKNTIKHSNRTFEFTKGLNLISGKNEAGKSLIFEYIDFALHGSQALRLPASSYSPNMLVELVVTINNVKYIIQRTTKKATIVKYADSSLIATGTKPVDAEIKKMLGYSRNVYLVSNYSSQDAINFLSSLKPAERKKTIDNVVGLSAVEKVVAEHKQELTMLNRLLSAVKNREFIKPIEPENPYADQDLDKLIESYKQKAQSISIEIGVQKNLSIQHTSLDNTKPTPMNKPLLGFIIKDLTEQKIAEVVNRIKFLKQQKGFLTDRINQMVIPEEVQKPDLNKIIPNLTEGQIEQAKRERDYRLHEIKHLKVQLSDLPIKMPLFSEETILDTIKKENLYQEWLEVQNLTKKGYVTCTQCRNRVLLAQDLIHKKYSHVPEYVEEIMGVSADMQHKNTMYKAVEKTRGELTGKLEVLQHQEDLFSSKWYTDQQLEDHLSNQKLVDKRVDYLAAKDKYDRDLSVWNEQLLEAKSGLESFDNWHTDYEIEQHREALKAQTQYEKYLDNLKQWERSKEAIKPFVGEDTLKAWQLEVDNLNTRILEFRTVKGLLLQYEQDCKQYQNWLNEEKDAREDVEAEKLTLEALANYKQKIKTSILPSVNSVATQWMKRMSLGLHSKVELTEDMDILVNGEPIEALSISGRALGHLSLRMALGQVLTNHVFPVFMADEVDASMRDERGQEVIDALYEMLKGSMQQVIMISHRKLNTESVSNLIEV